MSRTIKKEQTVDKNQESVENIGQKWRKCIKPWTEIKKKVETLPKIKKRGKPLTKNKNAVETIDKIQEAVETTGEKNQDI